MRTEEAAARKSADILPHRRFHDSHARPRYNARNSRFHHVYASPRYGNPPHHKDHKLPPAAFHGSRRPHARVLTHLPRMSLNLGIYRGDYEN